MTWLGMAGAAEYYIPDLMAAGWRARGLVLIRRDAAFPAVSVLTPIPRVSAESVPSVHSVPDSAVAHLPPKAKPKRARRKTKA